MAKAAPANSWLTSFPIGTTWSIQTMTSPPETHSGGTGDWANQVYAHQMFNGAQLRRHPDPELVAQKSKKKDERINAIGCSPIPAGAARLSGHGRLRCL